MNDSTLLRDMALFVEVARRRSFTGAAQALDLPASTLSRRIRALELSLGLALLTRTTRRVDLTDAGADYLSRCAHLVEEARVAHEQVRASTRQATGTLRLSCTPDFATLYLPPVLEALTRAHPQLNVSLDLSARAVDLLAENLDAAVRIGPLPDSSLVARPLGTLRQRLYATPGYLRSAPVLLQPADLAQQVCVRLRSGEGGQTWTLEPEGGGPACRVMVQGRFAAGSVSMVRELVLRGAGIGGLDPRLAEPDVVAGRLVAVLPGWAPIAVAVHLLTASRFSPARVRVLGDALVEALAA